MCTLLLCRLSACFGLRVCLPLDSPHVCRIRTRTCIPYHTHGQTHGQYFYLSLLLDLRRSEL